MLIAEAKSGVADDCNWLNVYIDNHPLLLDNFVKLASWKKINDLREDKLSFNHNLAILKPQNY